jgi:hypothetical protein
VGGFLGGQEAAADFEGLVGDASVIGVSDVQPLPFVPPTTPPSAAIPETSTWVMVAIGFALLLFMIRRHPS